MLMYWVLLSLGSKRSSELTDVWYTAVTMSARMIGINSKLPKQVFMGHIVARSPDEIKLQCVLLLKSKTHLVFVVGFEGKFLLEMWGFF